MYFRVIPPGRTPVPGAPFPFKHPMEDGPLGSGREPNSPLHNRYCNMLKKSMKIWGSGLLVSGPLTYFSAHNLPSMPNGNEPFTNEEFSAVVGLGVGGTATLISFNSGLVSAYDYMKYCRKPKGFPPGGKNHTLDNVIELHPKKSTSQRPMEITKLPEEPGINWHRVGWLTLSGLSLVGAAALAFVPLDGPTGEIALGKLALSAAALAAAS